MRLGSSPTDVFEEWTKSESFGPDALGGVACGDVGELALEGGNGGPIAILRQGTKPASPHLISPSRVLRSAIRLLPTYTVAAVLFQKPASKNVFRLSG